MGKPSREEKAVSKGEFRSRVVQKGQKGPTCWYYALNLIRQRVGPVHDPDMADRRKIECFFSKVRKQLTFAGKMIRPHTSMTLYRTVESLIYQHALSILEVDVEKSFQTELRMYCGWGITHFNQIEIQRKVQLLQGMLFKQWVKCNHAGYSTWKPSQNVEALIDSLRRHGPHFFIGFLGQAFHSKFPFPYREICGIQILGWRPESKTSYDIGNHAVVVIGAEKGSKGELVYFIDPQDERDPEHPKSERVYVMSYRKFRSSVADLSGFFGLQIAFPFAIVASNQ